MYGLMTLVSQTGNYGKGFCMFSINQHCVVGLDQCRSCKGCGAMPCNSVTFENPPISEFCCKECEKEYKRKLNKSNRKEDAS